VFSNETAYVIEFLWSRLRISNYCKQISLAFSAFCYSVKSFYPSSCKNCAYSHSMVHHSKQVCYSMKR